MSSDPSLSSLLAANSSLRHRLSSIVFTPSSTGMKSAVITILSNDSDEGSYVINLTGTGTTATGLLGSTSNSFNALVGPNPSNGIYNITSSEKIDKVILTHLRQQYGTSH